jgi:hypothetical protein
VTREGQPHRSIPNALRKRLEDLDMVATTRHSQNRNVQSNRGRVKSGIDEMKGGAQVKSSSDASVRPIATARYTSR